MKKLLVKNIGLLATPEGKSAHRGEEQGKIKFLKDAWVLIEDSIIASVGTGAVPAVEGAEAVDAEGHLVTPAGARRQGLQGARRDDGLRHHHGRGQERLRPCHRA